VELDAFPVAAGEVYALMRTRLISLSPVVRLQVPLAPSVTCDTLPLCTSLLPGRLHLLWYVWHVQFVQAGFCGPRPPSSLCLLDLVYCLLEIICKARH
jgi:hypothetical protein